MTDENSSLTDNKKEIVLFVGNARPPEYRFFKDQRILIGLLYDAHCPIAYPADGDFTEVIEVTSEAGALQGAYDSISDRFNVVAQVAAVETAVYDNALLASYSGLPAPSIEAAQLALDKAEMRRIFEKALGPESTSVSDLIFNEIELEKFANENSFPIILKPTNLFGSMFVSKSYSFEELCKNYRWMSDEIRTYLNQNGRKDEEVGVQAETYLEGTNHSIDCIVDGYGQPYPTEIVDVLTERSFGIDKVQHFARYAPSALSSQQQDDCKTFAKAAVQALGLTNCVAHVEFILTNTGPKLLEIAARPGGNRVHMMREIFGIDIMAAYFASLSGKPINVARRFAKPRAIISIYPEKSGAFAGLRNDELIKALPGYMRHGLRVSVGELVGPASDGHLPTLSIELTGTTLDSLMEAITTAREVCSTIETTIQ